MKHASRELASLFLAFLKLGLFTIGGGMAMIPQMQQIAVDEHHWLTEEEVIDCIAVSQSLPGVIAINMATFIGRKLYGVAGAVTATVAVALPSFVIILVLAAILEAVNVNPWINGAFLGVKAGICGLILISAVRLGKQVLKSAITWILMILSLLAVGVMGINAVWAIMAAAAAGIIRQMIVSRKEDG